MLEKANQPKIVVLGVGNLLLRDEGVGIHLVQALNGDDLGYTNLEVIDSGTSPDILSVAESADKLIIIDAVKGGGEPGTIYRFSVDQVNLDSPIRLSLHQMGVVDNLRILDLLGKQPRNTVIIGIEPKTVDWGLELSWEVEKKMAEITRLVKKEIEETEQDELHWR